MSLQSRKSRSPCVAVTAFYTFILLCNCIKATDVVEEGGGVASFPSSKTVKKELKNLDKIRTDEAAPLTPEKGQPAEVPASAPSNAPANQQTAGTLVISEKTLQEHLHDKEKGLEAPASHDVDVDAKQDLPTKTAGSEAEGKVTAEESGFKHKLYHEEDDDIPDSLRMSFYFFLLLSTSAVAFILFKVYRLRLSRAERKYGVHGDRTTQELTPLPVSLEDGNSDEDDQTLFEINRQQIRIL